MLALLLFAFLGILQQSRQVQDQVSLALPLVVRSPYLNCWLQQTNSSIDVINMNLIHPMELTALPDRTDVYGVCPFSKSNSTLHLRSLCLLASSMEFPRSH